MRALSSFSTRLITATLLTAAATFGMLLGLVLVQAGKSLERQTEEISRWSEERLAQRLMAETLLALARLNNMHSDISRRFASLSQRTDISKAIQSRNSVAISELLAPAIKLADIDGVMVLDEKLRVMGAHRLDIDILGADKLLRSHSLMREIEGVATRNNPKSPRRYSRAGRFDDYLAAAVGAERNSALAEIFIEPVFDEFGDVVAVLIGHRQLRASEPTLMEFSRLTGRGVLILSSGNLVSSTLKMQAPDSNRYISSGLIQLDNDRYVARCVDLWSSADICAVAQSAELQQLANQIIAIGQEQNRSLVWTLVGAIGIAMTLFALMSLVVSRHMTQPLVKIAGIVGEVARGNWRIHVPGRDRRDEVGDIARAVVLLEESLEERDKLRADVVNQNAVLLQMTRHDTLTGLPNRLLFRERLDQAIAGCPPRAIRLCRSLPRSRRFQGRQR